MTERNSYTVPGDLALPERANPKKADISPVEWDRARRSEHGFPRLIRGDEGDLGFLGYTVCHDRTVLHDAVLLTRRYLDPAEVAAVARRILDDSYRSIGIATVEN